MFALVEFDDSSLYLCKLKDVTTRDEKSVVRYKGSRYAVKVIEVNEQKSQNAGHESLAPISDTTDYGTTNSLTKCNDETHQLHVLNTNTVNELSIANSRRKSENEHMSNENKGLARDTAKAVQAVMNTEQKSQNAGHESLAPISDTTDYGTVNSLTKCNDETQQLHVLSTNPVNELAIANSRRKSENERMSNENEVLARDTAKGVQTVTNTEQKSQNAGHESLAPISDTTDYGTTNSLTECNDETHQLHVLSTNTEMNVSLSSTAEMLMAANDSIWDNDFLSNEYKTEELSAVASKNTTPPWGNASVTISAHERQAQTEHDTSENTLNNILKRPKILNNTAADDNRSEASPERQDDFSDESYVPDSDDESDEDNEMDNSLQDKTNTTNNTTANSCQSFDALNNSDALSKINVVGHSAPNDENMFVLAVETGLKKDYCLYCNTLQAKLSRHVIRKHRNEKDVKELLNYARGSKERKKMMAKIRKKGHFSFNTNPTLNTGERKVVRRSSARYGKKATDYATCPKCLGDYAKSNIRHHVSMQCSKRQDKRRDIILGSKQITGRIHKEASNILRQRVFPSLQEDEVVKSIRYDELVILFGNKLCQKYKDPHFYDMIRQKLRQLGRFLIGWDFVRKFHSGEQNVTEKDYYRSLVVCINNVKDWDGGRKLRGPPKKATHVQIIVGPDKGRWFVLSDKRGLKKLDFRLPRRRSPSLQALDDGGWRDGRRLFEVAPFFRRDVYDFPGLGGVRVSPLRPRDDAGRGLDYVWMDGGLGRSPCGSLGRPLDWAENLFNHQIVLAGKLAFFGWLLLALRIGDLSVAGRRLFFFKALMEVRPVPLLKLE
ncbi:uncharacterized protein [Venturia canescens]|uniref:uncharacterized protein n=1 Tax=Venturia canescens TaxID=32260 RepID=UPI001C9CED6D|nr:uncharacterized protein LOC122417747 [Venturia canescens]